MYIVNQWLIQGGVKGIEPPPEKNPVYAPVVKSKSSLPSYKKKTNKITYFINTIIIRQMCLLQKIKINFTH